MDFIDMNKYAKTNDSIYFIFTIINVFNKAHFYLCNT